MSSDTNQTEAPTEKGAGDGGAATIEKIELAKAEYEELVGLKATTGSLKRDLKDAQKKIEELSKPKETHNETKSGDVGLLQKGYLRMSGITAEDEVEFALSTAKKWGMDVDKIVDDEDFQVKLKRMRDTKSNTVATSNVRGGSGTSEAKNTPEFWKAKGTPPTPTDVPDTKLRRKIIREMTEAATNTGIKFYNE